MTDHVSSVFAGIAGEAEPMHRSSAAMAGTQTAELAGGIDLKRWIVDWIAPKLGVAPSSIEHDKPLIDYGMDSTLAVDLAGRLEQLLGRPISPSIAWDCPTIAEIAATLGAGGGSPEPQTY